jgi:hypothetical protein
VGLNHKQFAKWLLQTFPQLTTSNDSTQQHVLDVAGVKGELAARLCFCHGLNVVMVDPSTCDIVRCFESLVLPKLPKKWQQRLKAQQEANPHILEEIKATRFQQLVTTFDQTTLFLQYPLYGTYKKPKLNHGSALSNEYSLITR